MNINFYKTIPAAIILFAGINANAYDFKVDGLYYNILSESDRTVEVTYCNCI